MVEPLGGTKEESFFSATLRLALLTAFAPISRANGHFLQGVSCGASGFDSGGRQDSFIMTLSSHKIAQMSICKRKSPHMKIDPRYEVDCSHKIILVAGVGFEPTTFWL